MDDIVIVYGLMIIPTGIISAIWAYFIDKSFTERTKRNETVHQTISDNI